MSFMLGILLASLVAPPDIDFDSLPPFAPSREIVEPILKQTGREMPSEREWEYLQHHLATNSRVPLRNAAITALDKEWVGRCDFAAQKVFGRNATSAELLVWQSYGFACHDAAVVAWSVKKTHGAKPARVKGRVVDDKSSEPLNGVRVFGQWPDVASTDADGNFEIETGREWDGSQSLKFEMAGKAKELLRFKGDADAEPATLRMTPEVEFVGAVADKDGKAVERAGVEISVSTGDYRQRLEFAATTDVDGRFRLVGWGNPRLKQAYVTIHAPGYEKFNQSMSEQKTTETRTPNNPESFRLKPAPDVAGQVVDEAGAPVAAASVEVRKAGGSGCYMETLSDHEGRFRLNSEPGNWVIVAEKSGLSLAHAEVVLTEASKRDLKIVMPSNGGYIEGKMLLPDGKPAANCSIGWVRRSSKANAGGDQWNDELGSNHHTVTDDEGRFRVGPFDPKESYEVTGLVGPPRMTGKVIAKPGDADVVIQLAKER